MANANDFVKEMEKCGKCEGIIPPPTHSSSPLLEKCKACNGLVLSPLNLEVLRQRHSRTPFTATQGQPNSREAFREKTNGDATRRPLGFLTPPQSDERMHLVEPEDIGEVDGRVFITLDDIEEIKAIKDGLQSLQSSIVMTDGEWSSARDKILLLIVIASVLLGAFFLLCLGNYTNRIEELEAEIAAMKEQLAEGSLNQTLGDAQTSAKLGGFLHWLNNLFSWW